MAEDFMKPAPKGTYEPIGAATLQDHDGNSLRLKAGTTTVEVAVLADGVFRIGAFPNGRNFRYDTPATDGHEPVAPGSVAIEETDGGYTLKSGGASVGVALNPLRISFTDTTGLTFCADDGELGMGFFRTPGANVFTKPLGDAVKLNKQREAGERTFGCGQRSGPLDKSGTRQTFYNADPPEGHTDSMDNLYSSTPFTLTLKDGRAHGLLFDNPSRSVFDLGKETPGINSYESLGGDLIYYVFAGPTPKDVLRQYTEVTGRTPLPPMWALGNQQCRWSYETADEVREIAHQMRERDIPCDVVYLDIDYMDGFRVFTWDEEAFPKHRELLAELKADGFDVVAIVDPGVKVDENYPVYVEGREKGYFVRTAVNEEYQNAVWPGVCAFPDFASEAVRKWWGENHRQMLEDGISGIWCDMNEPSLFVPHQSTMPDDAVHNSGARSIRHGEIHNAYGQLMVKGVREGLLDIAPDRRPFVISRSGYAGLQRHAMQWMGDNSSWWEHLYMAMPQLMNVGLSGVAHAGVDIGGFFDDTTGELLARFTEFGVFQPFCRNHSVKGSENQEPWAFGEPYESVCRAMISLRMRLLPHFYTLFEESHRTGAPIMRPLLFEYPEDAKTYAADDEFLLGESVLVAPITKPGIEHRHVYLPKGTWFHYWTCERFDGEQHILAHAPLGQPAVYLKANTALPLGPVRMNTKELTDAPLTYLVYSAEGEGTATLYEDAGDGYAQESGEYARRTIRTRAADGATTITIEEREGTFVPERSLAIVDVRGIERPSEVTVNGERHDFDYEDGALKVRFPESASEAVIKAR
ncbi:TIM-barrel domain-containing protein [Rubrobacter indicoceani]|uniref:glycoside hydrolase family 31 protein n=1 Tax=Rubrobacter indicoceani TaxID=2051957 RepID=UPI000E5A3A11|nr:TIM-barrel domain-containing protein [Rubrobacter indicoceani]